MQGNMVHIKVFGKSSSDLRARFNSTLRSVRAVSEALMSIDQQENAEV
jgi:tRNA threonylcarbamoyladenosine modification (KEOPS) complex  Pcc1 subunit